MIFFTVCDGRGFVAARGRGPVGMAERNAPPGGFVLEGIHVPDDHYVDPATRGIQPRPAMPVSVDGLILTCPPGADFTVRGAVDLQGQADHSGVLEFVFEVPGAYRVELESFPYLPEEVTLYVGACQPLSGA